MDATGVEQLELESQTSHKKSANNWNVNRSANNADCHNFFNTCCSGICFGIGEVVAVLSGCFDCCTDCCGKCLGACCVCT